MRRTTFSSRPKSQKRQSLEDQALKAMRDTRAGMDPALLEMIKNAAIQGHNMGLAQETSKVEIVDKRKTYEMVLKFMTLQKANQTVMKELAVILKGQE